MKPLCHGLNELKEFAMSSHRMTCKPNILVNGREGDCWSIGVLHRKVIEKSYPENGWRVISIIATPSSHRQRAPVLLANWIAKDETLLPRQGPDFDVETGPFVNRGMMRLSLPYALAMPCNGRRIGSNENYLGDNDQQLVLGGTMPPQAALELLKRRAD
ncbi:hypothetical protein PHLCEN_2v4316 [Hermanssonia centrifuga]|uniref:Uncharacterized protein n=1 Tax=Hermanssonia centrifuga TaxID=98765 RepID=A0A2R6PVI3_9APHY|nr:hypothetical protein PHLCEN_2v4316 [Hermanssonia centrifuga]